LPGEPLLVPILQQGQLASPLPTLAECRVRCEEQRRRIPPVLLALERCPPYPVRVSEGLEEAFRRLTAPSS